MVKWRHSSIIIDLVTRWKRMVSFTSLPLYPRVKSLRYALDRRAGWAPEPVGCCGEKKNLAVPGIEPGPSYP
jgi:hypothetical protein